MSESEQLRQLREEAEKAIRDAKKNADWKAGPVLASVAIATAIREQTQVMREAFGV